MGIETYLQDTSDLLHDANFLFTSRSQLRRWVNEARNQAAQRTGCVQRLVSGQSAFGASAQPGSFIPGGAQPGALPDAVPVTSGAFVVNAAVNSLQTIPGQERYPFVGFFNPYLKAAHAGCEKIIDVNSCAVNWGGAARPSLAWMAWEDLQAYARAYATQISSYPYYWSIYNPGSQGELWFFPAPSTAGDIELDAYVIPSPLYTDDDFDVIPDGFQNAIKYGAAAIAFMTSFRYAQAQIMEGMFNERLGVGGVARDRGKVSNYYYTSF